MTKHLERWMAPQKRDVSIVFATGKNRVIPMPKGVVGIVSPWNYPLVLTLNALTSVLAAGNRAMIKMAPASQNLCRLLADTLREVFPEDTVAILPGVRAQDVSSRSSTRDEPRLVEGANAQDAIEAFANDIHAAIRRRELHLETRMLRDELGQARDECQAGEALRHIDPHAAA